MCRRMHRRSRRTGTLKRARHLVLLAFMSVVSIAGANASGTTSDWQSDIERQIAAEEYHVSWQTALRIDGLASAWHAPNRAQGLRTYFAPQGPRIVPRLETQPRWEWGLFAFRYGRGARMNELGPAVSIADGPSFHYDRGIVQERYLNAPRGLLQRFVLQSPPDHASDEPEQLDPADVQTSVHLDLQLSGSLAPSIGADGRTIDFRAGDGMIPIRLGGVTASDAAGRELPVRLVGFTDSGLRGLRVVVDDLGAIYPLTVSGSLTAEVWTKTGDQASGWFGIYAGSAGDVNGDGYADVIVSAAGYDNGEPNEGRVFVFDGSPSGPASTPSWTVESDQAGAMMGRVATAGDVNGDGFADVLIGIAAFDAGMGDEGRALAFYGSAAGLPSVPDWSFDGDQPGAALGYSIATAGDVNGDGYSDVVIGARDYDGAAVDGGKAFVFHGSATGVTPTPVWTRDNNRTQAAFGTAVSTAGDVNGDGYSDVIVGGQAEAQVFHGSSAGLGTGVPNWSAMPPVGGFGSSVATAGDINGDGYADVVVGAWLLFDSLPGRVFVYYGSPSGIAGTEATWELAAGSPGDTFGFSLGTAGDVNGDGYADIVVGAPTYHGVGGVFIYYGLPSHALNLTPEIVIEGLQPGAWFGVSAATAGDVNGDGYSDLIVGSYMYDANFSNQGLAQVYLGSNAGVTADFAWNSGGPLQAEAHFGISVSGAGDVNGDGYADVIVGADLYDSGSADAGLAAVFHGSAAGLETTAAWTAEGDQEGERFGFAVAGAGDVNGDGYSDVIVGAFLHDNGQVAEGRAWVFHGSPTGLDPTAAWMAESDQIGAEFGYAVAGAGDVNGDGYGDVVIGAPGWGGPPFVEGRARVYHGSPTGLGPTPAWTAEVDQEAAAFGASVATAGDVNRDGFSDVIVGAYLWDSMSGETGRAWIYPGAADGLAATTQWTLDGQQHGAWFGLPVATAGDVNGDGYSDVIVGARYQLDGGTAFVYHGGSDGVTPAFAWSASGSTGAEFGASVATAGDVNGDGYADVVVGAPGDDSLGVDGGRVQVYHGSASGLNPEPAFHAEYLQANTRLGAATAAGDVNGDGYADVIVGQPLFDYTTIPNGGRAWVYYGGGNRGVGLRPEQRRADNTAPVARLGHVDGAGFRLAALGRSPLGRAEAMLQWEVKPVGQPFDGTNVGSSGFWSDTGLQGVALSALTSAADLGPQHWRVRLRYHPARSPFLGASRWFTIPWAGGEEADLVSVDGISPPIGFPSVALGKSGDDIQLSWPPIPGATAYDVVSGDLTILRTASGDFSAAVVACLLDDGPDTSLVYPGNPPTGGAWWILVRGVSAATHGTLDSGSAAQQGLRDAEIAASAASCP